MERISEHDRKPGRRALGEFVPRIGSYTVIVIDEDGAFVARECTRELWQDSDARGFLFRDVADALSMKHRWMES